MNLRIGMALVVAFLLSLSPFITQAHEGATGIVKERMDTMKTISDRMKAMAKMIKGNQPYDAARVSELATEVRKHGGDTMLSQFPKGSIHGPSEALPEIWQDWETFRKLAQELSDTAGDLAARVTSKPSEPPVDIFKALAKNCKACHDDFRLKK